MHTIIDAIVYTGIGPITPHNDPLFYSLWLIALAFTLLKTATVYVSEVIQDSRKGMRFLSAARSNIVTSGLFLAIGMIALVCFWFAYRTPPESLPFARPAADAHLLFLSLNGVYTVFALLLHGVVGYLATQVVLGMWIFPPLNPNKHRAVLITVVVLVILLTAALWEIERWPLHFVLTGEIILNSVVGTFLTTALVTLLPASLRKPKLQRGFLLAYCAVSAIVIWLAHGLSLPQTGMGPILRAENPFLYPFVIAALAITAISRFVDFGNVSLELLKQRPFLFRFLRTELLLLIFEWLLIYFVWLAYATPVGRLPFTPPSSGSYWLFLPADGVYYVLAVIAHALMAATGVLLLVAIWTLGELGLNSDGLIYPLIITLAAVLGVIGWEWLQWPAWIVVPTEFLLIWLIRSNISGFFAWLRGWMTFKTLDALRRVTRLPKLFSAIITLSTVLFIMFTHDIRYYWINLLGIYFALVTLDAIAKELLGLLNPQSVVYGSLSPKRWFGTLPVAIGFTLLAASGALAPFSSNSGLSQTAWIEIGTVACAYLLFKPLVDFGFYASQQRELGLLEAVSDSVLSAIISIGEYYASRRRDLRPQPDSTIERVVESTLAGGATASTETEADSRALTVGTSRAFQSSAAVSRARYVPTPPPTDRLNLHVGRIFYVAGFAYYLLVTYFHFSSVSGNLVPLGFALIGLVAGLLALINNPVTESPRTISLLLLFVTIVVAGITVLFTIAPSPHELGLLRGASADTLLTNSHFYAISLYISIQEFLPLLMVGQLAYFYAIINYTIAAEQRKVQASGDARANEARDWVKQGDTYYKHEWYAQALDAYERALESSPQSATIWRDKGLALRRLNRNEDALTALDEAVKIDDGYVAAWASKGYTLQALNRDSEAIAAFEAALARETRPAAKADILNSMTYTYLAMQQPENALSSSERAIQFAPADANYWDSKGEVLAVLGRDHEALEAFDQALARSPNFAYSWKNKAIILRRLGQTREADEAEQRAKAAQS